jgi:D-arabinose 1-dehydrogenase-like Zn-dependent alcohol dehydrogenase
MVDMMELVRVATRVFSKCVRMRLLMVLPVTVAVRFPTPLSMTELIIIDSEYTRLRSEAAVRIPSDVDPAEYAPLLCAGVTTFNGIRKMNIPQGGTVAIQGLGGLGHLAVQYARKMGYRTVVLSSSAAKKDFAFQLGATDYIDGSKEDTAEALQKIGGADLIVVTAPNPKVMGPLINGCAPLGKVLILAREYLMTRIIVIIN